MKDADALELVIEKVFSNDAHVDVEFSSDEIPHPLRLGFRVDIGEPRGQIADYRYVVGEHSVHAREYPGWYRIHWDLFDPLVNAFEHLRRDSPAYFTLATTSTGLSVGAAIGAFSKNKSDVAAGALIGGLVGLALGLITADW